MRPGRRRRSNRLLLVALLAALAGAARAQCDVSGAPTSLSIEGFGTVYFRDFETDAARTRAELSGGICVAGPGAEWTVQGRGAVFTGLRPPDRLRVEIAAATLILPPWRLESARLLSDGERLSLEDTLFTGSDLSGRADSVEVDLDGGSVTLEGLSAVGNGFRLGGARALLEGERLTAEDATITTCVCPGEPLYRIVARRAELDLPTQELVLHEARLLLGRLDVALGERVVLSGDELQRLVPPLALEYRAGDPATGRPGTGLGLVASRLEVAPDLTLQLGVLGLDREHPLRAFGVSEYQVDGLRFAVGLGRSGPLAEFELEREVAPGLELGFAVRNLHVPERDYLHEGVLSARAVPPPLDLEGLGRVQVSAAAFAAASSQVLPGGVLTSPRLGVAAGVELEAGLGGAGRLEVLTEAEATHYPGSGDTQYGLRLRPAWRLQRGPLAVELSLDRGLTNGASPFSPELDRLEPRFRGRAELRLHGSLGGGAEGAFEAVAAYDLLGGDAEPRGAGFERLGALGSVSYRVGDWAVGTRAQLELTGLLRGAGGDAPAFFETGVLAERGLWELGGRVRVELRPEERGLSRLEARATAPLRLSGATLEPYLAVDFAPLLTAGAAPRISGHGLTVTWPSCCGVISAGYRQQDNVITTSFGVSFAR